MSVFLENHRRGSDYEASSPGRAAFRRPAKPRPAEDAPLWGFSYDRAEAVIHLLLAFAMVGGAAATLWTYVAPEQKVESPAAPMKRAAAPPAAPVPARATVAQPLPAQPTARIARPEDKPPALAAAPAPAMSTATPPAALPSSALSSALSPVSIANEPAPLAPPSPDVRARLAASAETAPRPVIATREPAPEAAPADDAPPPETAAQEQPQAEVESSRTAHCFLKLSGRVQTNAACRVQITDNGIIFQIPGKPLEIEHVRGRTWAATLGGRALGNVYKSGSCWGGRGFYACKNG